MKVKRLSVCFLLCCTGLSILLYFFFLCSSSRVYADEFNETTCRNQSETGQAGSPASSVREWVCPVCADSDEAVLGAAWFNMTPSTDRLDQSIQITLNISDSDKGGDSTKAYVHGQFYACKQSYSSPSEMNANHIHIIRGVGSYYGTQVGWGSSFPENLSFVKNISTENLIRSKDNANLSPNTWSKSGKPVSFEIDHKELINFIKEEKTQQNCYDDQSTSKKGCITQDDGGIVTINAGVYRCPLSAGATSHHKSGCGSDNQDMIIIYDGVRGKAKIKYLTNTTTIADDEIEDDDNGEGDSDYHDITTVGYDGSFHPSTAYTPAGGSAAQVGVAIGPVAVPDEKATEFTLKLKDGKAKHFNLNMNLKSAVDGITGKYVLCTNFNKTTSAGDLSSFRSSNCSEDQTADLENKGKNIGKMKVSAKISNGSIMVRIGGKGYEYTKYDKNTRICHAMQYFTDTHTGNVDYRAACIKFEIDPTTIKPNVQGRIVMEAAADPTSNGSSNTSTAQEAAKITIASPMTSWENGSHVTKDVSTTVNGSSADVYAQWQFDAKLDKTGKYKAKIIGCRSISNDVCENWIKDVTISDYRSINSGSKINGSDGTKILTKKSIDSNEDQSAGTYTFNMIEENKAHEYSDALPKNGSYTVCYKSFVAEYSAPDDTDDAENPAWNTSYACAKFKDQQDGEVQGKTTLKYNNNSGSCTIGDVSLAGATSSLSGNTHTIERTVSTSNNDAPTIVTLKCPTGTGSVNVNFSHKFNSSTVQDQITIKGKKGQFDSVPNNIYSLMDNNVFYHKKLPETLPGAIQPTTITSNSTGTYSLPTTGEVLCEGLFMTGRKNALVCVMATEDNDPGDAAGKSIVQLVGNLPSGCSVQGGGTSREKPLSVGGRNDTANLVVTCNSAVTFKFTHQVNGQNMESTRHRLYHGSGSGSVSPSKDHNHSGDFSASEYTNSNGQYTISPNEKICESQWLGVGESTAKIAKVCAEVVPEGPIGCPNAVELSPSKDSGDSYLVTTIKNISTGATSSVNTYTSTDTSTETLLAKPTDQITFNHCYYNGAQAVRTTEYWDQIKEEKPSDPTSALTSACKKVYKQGETVPTHCDTAPTYNLSPKSSTCTNDDWTNCDGASGSSYNDYTAEASKLETLKEADYVKGSKTTNNSLYNSYSVSTTYPNVNILLGNGVYDGTASSISDDETSDGYISMDYGGNGFSSNYNGGTGTEGEVGTGIAENARNTFVTVGAPGGYLTQSVTAYVGKVARKQHEQTWKWDIAYNFTKCEQQKIPDTNPVEYKPADECVPTLGTVSDSSTNHGKGSGDHGNAYYERDEDATTYENKTISASVYVPYNYTSSALVELAGDKIYSGERFTLQNSFVYINPKTHSSLGTYATIAPDINVELYAYISDDDQTSRNEYRTSGSLNGCAHYLRGTNQECATIDSTTRTFNVLGKMSGTQNAYKESPFPKTSYNAFDYVAGRYLCVGLGFNRSETTTYSYASNGSELNNDSIYYSSPSCKKIYKKPTFAVWGGSVFSNGNIDVNKMEKRNVRNYNNYQSQGTVYMVTFSPWVEGVVVGNNTVKNLASGAATGYTFAGTSGTFAPVAAPGGFAGNDYCNMSAITVANENCASGTAGDLNQGNRTGVKTELIRRYIEPFFDFDTNTQKTGSDCSGNGRNLCFTPGNGTFSADGKIERTDVEYGTTYIYASKNDITINADITYKEQYVSPSHISQVIIYSKGNINIIGDVNRVDAILIAEGNVNTCSTGSDTCHKRLKINGSIIADKIDFRRLYGASVGSYSVEPAEIVNFSPTIFLWSSVEASSEINENITETYTRELAPRQ